MLDAVDYTPTSFSPGPGALHSHRGLSRPHPWLFLRRASSACAGMWIAMFSDMVPSTQVPQYLEAIQDFDTCLGQQVSSMLLGGILPASKLQSPKIWDPLDYSACGLQQRFADTLSSAAPGIEAIQNGAHATKKMLGMLARQSYKLFEPISQSPAHGLSVLAGTISFPGKIF